VKKPRPTKDAVLAALQSGPKTRGELEQIVGKTLQATIHDMYKRREVHVHGWVRGTGNMRAMRMIYGLGDLPDAPKPPADRLSKYKRYYQKHKLVIKAKRKAVFAKVRDKINAAARRLRAKKKLVTNPFIQLSPELYRDLSRRAKKPTKRRKVKHEHTTDRFNVAAHTPAASVREGVDD